MRKSRAEEEEVAKKKGQDYSELFCCELNSDSYVQKDDSKKLIFEIYHMAARRIQRYRRRSIMIPGKSKIESNFDILLYLKNLITKRDLLINRKKRDQRYFNDLHLYSISMIDIFGLYCFYDPFIVQYLNFLKNLCEKKPKGEIRNKIKSYYKGLMKKLEPNFNTARVSEIDEKIIASSFLELKAPCQKIVGEDSCRRRERLIRELLLKYGYPSKDDGDFIATLSGETSFKELVLCVLEDRYKNYKRDVLWKKVKKGESDIAYYSSFCIYQDSHDMLFGPD